MAQIGDLGAELNLLCRHGHTVGPLDFEWTDEDGLALDISTATFEAVIYADKTATTELDQFSVTVVDATAGQFVMTLSAADSALLPLGEMFYILSATRAGIKEPLVYGKLDMRVG